MFRFSNNSHLQVVRESLGTVIQEINMGCVQCGVRGWGVGTRSRMCHGGWGVHGVNAVLD